MPESVPIPRPSVNLYGTFSDRAVERAYRDWAYAENLSQTRWALFAAAILFALYLPGDLARFGFGAALPGLLALRALVVGSVLLAALGIRRLRTPDSLARGVLLLELLVVPAHWLIVGQYYDDVLASALTELLIVLALYLLIPNRLGLLALAGLYASAGYFFVAYHKLGVDPGLLVQLGTLLLLINVLGMFYAHRTQRLQRNQFWELLEERRLRQALELEVERREKLESELRQLATTDSLTGAWNRRHFLELATKEVNRSRRYGRPLAVMLIDIDNFKRINDTLGHSAGDQVLIRLARILRRTLRKPDAFGRLGGDEFAVLAPELDEDAARQMAERLREAMEVTLPGADFAVTISIGVATWNDHDETIEPAMHRADQALYQSKQEGRNRVALQS